MESERWRERVRDIVRGIRDEDRDRDLAFQR